MNAYKWLFKLAILSMSALTVCFSTSNISAAERKRSNEHTIMSDSATLDFDNNKATYSEKPQIAIQSKNKAFEPNVPKDERIGNYSSRSLPSNGATLPRPFQYNPFSQTITKKPNIKKRAAKKREMVLNANKDRVKSRKSLSGSELGKLMASLCGTILFGKQR